MTSSLFSPLPPHPTPPLRWPWVSKLGLASPNLLQRFFFLSFCLPQENQHSFFSITIIQNTFLSKKILFKPYREKTAKCINSLNVQHLKLYLFPIWLHKGLTYYCWETLVMNILNTTGHWSVFCVHQSELLKTAACLPRRGDAVLPSSEIIIHSGGAQAFSC